MGLFNTDLLRIETQMQYSVRFGFGSAAVSMYQVRQHPSLSLDHQAIVLAALHYGRILSVEGSNRDELFKRVGDAAVEYLKGHRSLDFRHWEIRVGNRDFFIWPWTQSSPERLENPKRYISKLMIARDGVFSINLKMSWTLEKILCPSSALLVISTVFGMLDSEGRQLLAYVLAAMNDYYGTPSKAAGVASETRAVAVAIQSLAAG